MGKLKQGLVIFCLAMNVAACKKDKTETNHSNLAISNLHYSPDTVTLARPGSTFSFQGSVDFSNASGGVSTFRLTTSTGSDLTVAVPSNSGTNGTLSGYFEVSFPATPGNFTFQIWIIDKAGNVSNKLQGSVMAVIDDGGSHWTYIASSWNLSKIIWANQRFIAVGYTGTIVTSTDLARPWTQLNSGTNTWLRGVAWSGTQYIVVGSSRTIIGSTDGTNWTSRMPAIPANDIWFSSVAWSGNGFVAAGFQYTGSGIRTAIFNSSDGNTWTANAFGVEEGEINTVLWANSQFIAVGRANGLPIILTSANGQNWTNRSTAISFGTGASLNDLTWTGSKYVAVGSGLAATSADGISWNVKDSAFAYWSATGIAWSGNKLIATTAGGEIYRSTDGLNWSQVFNTGYPLTSIAWSGFQYLCVGAPQPIMVVSPY